MSNSRKMSNGSTMSTPSPRVKRCSHCSVALGEDDEVPKKLVNSVASTWDGVRTSVPFWQALSSIFEVSPHIMKEGRGFWEERRGNPNRNGNVTVSPEEMIEVEPVIDEEWKEFSVFSTNISSSAKLCLKCREVLTTLYNAYQKFLSACVSTSNVAKGLNKINSGNGGRRNYNFEEEEYSNGYQVSSGEREGPPVEKKRKVRKRYIYSNNEESTKNVYHDVGSGANVNVNNWNGNLGTAETPASIGRYDGGSSYLPNLEAVNGFVESPLGMEKPPLVERKPFVISNGTLYRCAECSKVFNSRSSIVTHVRYEHIGHRYDCKICWKRIMRSSHLRAHFVKVHMREILADEMPKYSSVSDLVIDDFIMEITSSFQPKQNTQQENNSSNREFSVGETHTTHVLIHKEPENYQTVQCGFCELRIESKGEFPDHLLKVHQMVFTSDRSLIPSNYTCPVCEIPLLWNELIEHFQEHNFSNPYKCRLCGKGYSEVSRMLDHERTHVELTTHSCKLCGRKIDLRDLETHEEDCKRSADKCRESMFAYKCTKCEFVFPSTEMLQQHTEERHANELEKEQEQTQKLNSTNTPVSNDADVGPNQTPSCSNAVVDQSIEVELELPHSSTEVVDNEVIFIKVSPKGDKPKMRKSTNNNAKLPCKTTGSVSITLPFKSNPKVFVCNICSIKVGSELDLKKHWRTNEHQEKRRKKQSSVLN